MKNKVFVINQHSKIEDINVEVLKGLLDQDRGEDIYFDFKPGIKIKSDEYKYQVRKCFASFANTFGGFIFFGVQDNKKKHGLDRLEDLDRNSELGKEINDKFLSNNLCIPGIDFEGPSFLSINNKNVAVVKVLQTEKKPHAIKKDPNSPMEFWSRGSGTAKSLDYSELIRLLEESREIRKTLISLFLDLEEVVQTSNINIATKDNDSTLPSRFNSYLVKEWGHIIGTVSSDGNLLKKLFPIKSRLVSSDDRRDFLFSQATLPLTNKHQLIKSGNQAAAENAEIIKKHAEEIRKYLLEKHSVIREFVAQIK